MKIVQVAHIWDCRERLSVFGEQRLPHHLRRESVGHIQEQVEDRGQSPGATFATRQLNGHQINLQW